MSDPHSTLYSFPSSSTPQPHLHGIHPYPSPVSSHPVNGGLQIAYSNPSEGSHRWLTEQAVPIGYPIPTAIRPFIEKPMSFVASNPLLVGNWTNPSVGNDARKRKPKPKHKLSKMSQTVRCEICDIYCTSIDLYEKHLSGKKHLKSLQKKYAPHTTLSQPTSQVAVNSSLSGPTGAMSGNCTQGAPSAPIGEALGLKKQKLVKCRCAADSVGVCFPCDVMCNSEKALADHLVGKRHSVQEMTVTTVNGHGTGGASSAFDGEDLDAKTQKLMEGGVAEESMQVTAACNSDVAFADHIAGHKHVAQAATTSTMAGHDKNGVSSVVVGKDLETKKQKLMQGGVAKGSVRVCTTCNVVCNSEVAFADHIAGRKHIAQVQKSAAVAGAGGSNTNQPKPPTTKKSLDNIEVKKQRIEGNGTRAEAMRVCTLCNVVCNSDTVFNYHLAGQKHASMVKKLAETSITGAVPSVATS